VIERAVVLARGPRIEAADFPSDITARREEASPPSAPVTMAEAERRAVQAALAHTGWKKGEAARLLDISWPTLNKKIADYGLEPPREVQGS
jgi:DNA-binding NtrC family response regulator